MGRRPLLRLAALAVVMAACASGPAPSASRPGGSLGPLGSSSAARCVEDLPPRTSPTDFPLAVLHLAGDDLPPVVGEVEWQGGEQPVATTTPRAVHLQRFTVLQVQGEAELAMRMSDGVRMAAWTVEAIPSGTFRAGDLETGRARWSDGEAPDASAGVVCVPLADGSWVIEARITFPDGAGSGTYYWRINVSETPTS